MRYQSGSTATAFTAVAVAGGTALGAVMRLLLGAAIDSGLGTASNVISTTTVNLLGCLAFGAIAAISFHSPRLKAACGTGFCGGFTTFSAFVIVTLGATESVSALVAVLAIHLLGCPLAYLVGTKCARVAQRMGVKR